MRDLTKLLLVVWLLAGLVPLAQAQMSVRYYHTDALGSVVALTDADGNLVEGREYEPYGHQTTPQIQDGPGYTGHVQDAATGLTYMQQRYYDPGIGRFLSVDPVTADTVTSWNFNRYNYAASNPYKFTDPDGRHITIGGDEAYKESAVSRLAAVGAADPVLKAKIAALERSPNEHHIAPITEAPADARDPGAPDRAINVGRGSRADESNGVGVGTTTYYNPDANIGPPGSDYGTPEGVIAHELLGHAYDKDLGISDRSLNPKTGYPRSEERANDMEKRYLEGVKKTR